MMKKLTIALLSLTLVTGVAPAILHDKPEVKSAINGLSEPLKTLESSNKIIVLVDIKVGIDGVVVFSKLSQPKRYTSFNQLALAKVKSSTYPVKTSQGKPIAYWLEKQPVSFDISPLNTSIEPRNKINY